MGPITLFDKSFLQSLSIDESIWFNHYYLCNICPLFYIETLADLEKEMKNGRTAEEVVGNIADKFPQSGMPNSYHEDICLGNLLGNDIPMCGQILISSGRPVKEDNKAGIVIEETPESAAFNRWQQRDFLAVERNQAKTWRNHMSNLNLEDLYKLLRNFPLNYESTKRLEDIKDLVMSFLSDPSYFQQQLYFVYKLINIPEIYFYNILNLWRYRGQKSIAQYAPYASYVLLIDLVFIISMKRGFISSQRPSNRTDISYLKYLPFSNIFVSNDRLHKMLAPLFLREDQEFIWGEDLKADLKIINNYFIELPDEIKEKGIYYFASSPPINKDCLTTSIWKRHMNFNLVANTENYHEPKIDEELLSNMNKLADAKTIDSSEIDFDVSNPDFIMVKHLTNKKKGSWYILPKGIKN